MSLSSAKILDLNPENPVPLSCRARSLFSLVLLPPIPPFDEPALALSGDRNHEAVDLGTASMGWPSPIRQGSPTLSDAE